MSVSEDWMLETLFIGEPKALMLFNMVRQVIASFGPVNLEVTKTQVSFGVERKFAWVWLPQMWVKSPKGSITLTFALDRRLDHPMIKEVVEPRIGRWTHHIVIESESDLEANIMEWLREAYAFGLQKKQRGTSRRL